MAKVEIFFKPADLVPCLSANEACWLGNDLVSRKRALGHCLASEKTNQVPVFVDKAAPAVSDCRVGMGFECQSKCGKTARQKQVVGIHPTDVGRSPPCDRLIDACGLTPVRRAAPPSEPILPTRDHLQCIVG